MKNFYFFSKNSLPFQKIVVTLQPLLNLVFFIMVIVLKIRHFQQHIRVNTLAGMRAYLNVQVVEYLKTNKITSVFLQRNPANLENLIKILVQTKIRQKNIVSLHPQLNKVQKHKKRKHEST